MSGLCAGCNCLLGARAGHRWCQHCWRYIAKFKLWWKAHNPAFPLGSKCVDCGAEATGRDHRLYDKGAPTDLVCHHCNHRRGPAALPDWVVTQSRRLNAETESGEAK